MPPLFCIGISNISNISSKEKTKDKKQRKYCTFVPSFYAFREFFVSV